MAQTVSAVVDRISQAVAKRFAGEPMQQTVRLMAESGAMLALAEVERYLEAEGLEEAAAWVRAELDAVREH